MTVGRDITLIAVCYCLGCFAAGYYWTRWRSGLDIRQHGSGTVGARMRGTVAQDRCSAKTGTLIAVSALAGYCTTTAGTNVAFAFLMNGVNPAGAHVLQDRMTVALASYRP